MTMKFFDDDGTELNPDLIPKPDLCVTCAKDNEPGKEEVLCTMTPEQTSKAKKSFNVRRINPSNEYKVWQNTNGNSNPGSVRPLMVGREPVLLQNE